MKITPNIALRQRMIKYYWLSTRRVLIQSRQAIIDRAEHTDPQGLKDMVPRLLNHAVMNAHLVDLWSQVGGKFAYDTERMFNQKKGLMAGFENKDGLTLIGTPNPEPIKRLAYWQDQMKYYAAERSLAKTDKIMDTEAEAINKVIDDVISEAQDKYLSIPDTRKLMQEKLSEDLVSIENFEAERIARTECNSASNAGSFAVASENAEGVLKEWHLSDLNVKHRESHIEYDAMEPAELDYEYAPGLKYPGDPECSDGGEVINCLCFYTMDTKD